MCCLCGAKNLKSDLSVIWNISALPVKSQCIQAIKSPRNADTTHINILPYKITPHLQCSKVRQSILPQENSDDAARNKVPNMCQSRPTALMLNSINMSDWYGGATKISTKQNILSPTTENDLASHCIWQFLVVQKLVQIFSGVRRFPLTQENRKYFTQS